MIANPTTEETELINAAVSWLQDRLPSKWTIKRSSRSDLSSERNSTAFADTAIDITTPTNFITIAIEVRRSFAPRDAELLLSGIARTVRNLSPQIPILVIAPWLSARSQELLRAQGINYFDLTGNVSIRLEYPTLFISTQGATHDPEPLARGAARVRGPKAARLIRLLVDVRPPYGVTEIAKAIGLAPGYVSRLLDTLNSEALIERSRSGHVESIDIAGLLRRWAESYDLLNSNDASMFVAPMGPENVIGQLSCIPDETQVAVTGSFAAIRWAPVSAPTLLAAFCSDVDNTARALGLIPADRGANVILLRPFDPVVWERVTQIDIVKYAAPSQVVVDCLTGNGRMPAEGSALIDWMVGNEAQWRTASITQLRNRNIAKSNE